MGSDPARRARQRAIASFVAAAVCFAAAAGTVAFRHGPGHRFRDVAAMRHDRRDGPGPFGRGSEWGWERGHERGWDRDRERDDRGRMPPMPREVPMPPMPGMSPMPGMPGRDGPAPAPPNPTTSTTTTAPAATGGN